MAVPLADHPKQTLKQKKLNQKLIIYQHKKQYLLLSCDTKIPFIIHNFLNFISYQ